MPELIPITKFWSLNEDEIVLRFIRASGPGGQNVNKVATAVELRFDVRHSPTLPPDVRDKLERLAGRRLTQDGVLVLKAQDHRTQERNRSEAITRLVELLREASKREVPRRATRPTKASKERRLTGKAVRSGIKALRGRIARDD